MVKQMTLLNSKNDELLLKYMADIKYVKSCVCHIEGHICYIPEAM